eukprot:SAG31_NODE_8877_length_1369_cov_1.154331_2_plen_32_part_00
MTLVVHPLLVVAPMAAIVAPFLQVLAVVPLG